MATALRSVPSRAFRAQSSAQAGVGIGVAERAVQVMSLTPYAARLIEAHLADEAR